MRIEVDQCDRCERTDDIAFRGVDGKHCLCAGCIVHFLSTRIDPSRGRPVPAEEKNEICQCSFCKESTDISYTLVEVKRDGLVWICDTCLLNATRTAGSLRIHRDLC